MKLRNATAGTQVTEKASGRHGVIRHRMVGTGFEEQVRVRFEDSDPELLVHPRNLRRRRGGGSAFPETISMQRGGIRYPTPMTSAKSVNRGDTVIAHAGPLSEDEHGLRFQLRPATIERAEIYDASGPHTIRTPAPDPGGYLRAGLGEDHDPDLIERLRDLGDRFGPAGVAIVAAGLSDPNYVIARLLRTPYQAPTRPAEPAPDVVETAKQEGDVLPPAPSNGASWSHGFTDGDIVRLDNGSIWYLGERGGTLLHGEWLPGSMNDLLRERSPELLWALLSDQRGPAATLRERVLDLLNALNAPGEMALPKSQALLTAERRLREVIGEPVASG